MNQYIQNIISINKFSAYKQLEKEGLLDEIVQLTSFLDINYISITWSQRFYHIKYDDFNLKFCEVCGKPALYSKCLASYSKSCSRVCGATLASRESERKCIEVHGVANFSKVDSIKVKTRNTNKQKYGVDHPSQSKEVKEKIIKSRPTAIQKYKDTWANKSDKEISDMVDKMKATNRKKYGANFFSETNAFHEKLKSSCIDIYGVENYSMTDAHKQNMNNRAVKNIETYLGKYNILLLGYKSEEILCHCLKCDSRFIISHVFYWNRSNQKHDCCTTCNPRNKPVSILEKGIQSDIIKLLPDMNILFNNRTIISPYELDIYIPSLLTAVEINGDYYHANPKFYSKEDKIYGIPAHKIWDRDERKKIACEQKGINLITLWESDIPNLNIEQLLFTKS